MKFSCEKCSARYSIPDEKVHGKVLKVRCKKCSYVIVVRAKRQPSGTPPSQSQRTQWYVAIKGKQHGPMTKEGVVALLNKGRIRDRSFVWHKGLKSWTRLMEIEEFKAVLYPQASPQPQPPPQSQPQPQPQTQPRPRPRPQPKAPPGSSLEIEPSLQNKNLTGQTSATDKSAIPGTSFAPTEASDISQAPLSGPQQNDFQENPSTDSSLSSSIGDSFNAAASQLNLSSPFSQKDLLPKKPDEKAATDLDAAFDKVMGADELPQTKNAAPTSDDPFENALNRTDEDPLGFGGVAENTRIFMMKAGLHNRKKKQMSYAIAAFVMLACFSSALALDYYEIIEIPFMHSVTNFVAETTNLPRPKRNLASWDEDESTNNSLRCKMMGNCPKKKKKRKRGKKKDKLLGVDLEGAFQGLDGSGKNLKRAGIGKDGMANVDPFSHSNRSKEFASLIGKSGPTRARPVGKIDAPEVNSGSSLDPKNVSKVVRQGQEGIKQCLEAAIKRQEKVKGKKKKRLILTIKPNGRVGKAVFTDPILNAQALGECIIDRAKRWKFAPFAGEPTEVVLPVVLTTGI